MSFYYYYIQNTENGRKYHGSTGVLPYRVGEHIIKLFRKQHHSQELQRDFSEKGIGCFKFYSEEFDLEEEAALKEKHEIEVDGSCYNQRTAMPNLSYETAPSLKECIEIWASLKQYKTASTLVEEYDLPSRREVYKIYYYVEHAIEDKSEEGLSILKGPKRKTRLEEEHRKYEDEEIRIDVLCLLEFLFQSQSTISTYLGVDKTNYFTNIAASDRRWAEDKKKYCSLERESRLKRFVDIMLDNNLFQVWLDNLLVTPSFEEIIIYLFINKYLKGHHIFDRNKIISEKSHCQLKGGHKNKYFQLIKGLFEDSLLDNQVAAIYRKALLGSKGLKEKHDIAKIYAENPCATPLDFKKVTNRSKPFIYGIKKNKSYIDFVKLLLP